MANADKPTAAEALAHAINNPLTVVLANLTFALEELTESSRVTEHSLVRVRQALTEAIASSQRIRDEVIAATTRGDA